jgi:hypothetical protein
MPPATSTVATAGSQSPRKDQETEEGSRILDARFVSAHLLACLIDFARHSFMSDLDFA